MRLFTYVVAVDSGFAPNPFGGYCTLAVCKPRIRNTAKIGDWIAGITPKRLGNKLLYAMQVKEKITFNDYYKDKRFQCKKPKLSSQDTKLQCGDNFYFISKDGSYQQKKNNYHNKSDEKRDLSSEYVLISDVNDFYYFGSDAIELPEELKQIMSVMRGHRSNFEEETIRDFIQFISTLEDKKGTADRLPRDFNFDKKCKRCNYEACTIPKGL